MKIKNKDFLDDETLFYNDNMELPKKDIDDLYELLEEIRDRVDRIEKSLEASHPSTVPIQESIQSALHAPANVRPKGTMLEEIQTVLTAQDAMKDQAGVGEINTNCSLPSSIIDDEI